MSYELDGWDYHAYQMKVDRARDKHATISEFGLNKQEIAKHEEYLEQNKDNIVQTFVPKTMSFMDKWQYIVNNNFAIYNNRGKNKIMCCLQFGGNLEFFEGFPNEKPLTSATNKQGVIVDMKTKISTMTTTINIFILMTPLTKTYGLLNEKQQFFLKNY